MNDRPHHELTELLFPDVTASVAEMERRYPPRMLAEGALVTRFAPSPTGFLHLGGLFTAIVAERLAHQSGGVFILRIEDTDKKREVAGGVDEITAALRAFGVRIDEGVRGVGEESGTYGPYLQSERKDLYLAYVKALIAAGYAYPCFCTAEELEAARAAQEAAKVRPGYYGRYATHRDTPLTEVRARIERGESFVVRLRSQGDGSGKRPFTDRVKGAISVTENDQDVVLLKSDRLPTYHLAHVVDDHLMQTSIVIRGDEWLSSLPIHLELFERFGWATPQYAHIAPILKAEAGGKRKLSKRKDPEAAVSYYAREGYPSAAVIEYLLNIANSEFEPWRREHPDLPNDAFAIRLERFNKSGALYDRDKLVDISKGVVARMSATAVFDAVLAWARAFDVPFAERLANGADYARAIFGIERSSEKPRKDIATWSEVPAAVAFFYDDLYEEAVRATPLSFPEGLAPATVREILAAYPDAYDAARSRDEWFEALKTFGERFGFARDAKAYKADPDRFAGQVGDVAMVLRIALTTRTKAPDLHAVLHVLGTARVHERLARAAAGLAQ